MTASLAAGAAADPFLIAADILDPPQTGVLAYHDDPAGFARDCVKWEHGEGLTDYQLENMSLLVKHKRLAVRGPHGLGKTATSALLILWFALTRDAAGEDWKIPTTASAWRQLKDFLWPEVHKWTRKLDWGKIGRPPFTALELQSLGLKLRHGHAFAVACTDPATIEGVHADQVLYVYDEAKTIPDRTFDATEGAFSGAGEDTKAEAFALASSTPGPPSGRFYNIHKRMAGYEDWHVVHVTLAQTIAAGRVAKDWVAQRARQWGERSAVFINRVLGEFAASEEDGVIPLAWVEKAVERYHELPEQNDDIDPLKTLGVDVADSGDNRTVIAYRFGNAIRKLKRYDKQDPMQTAGTVHGILEAHKHPARQISAIVDAIGVGAGVVPRLRETSDQNIVAFVASAKSERRDVSGQLGYANCRAAAWWNLREMLDPDLGADVALPDGDRLIGDLTTPTWRMTSGGKILIEAKEDIKKRLDRSTDDGDAVVMAFWPEGGVTAGLEKFARDPDSSFFASSPQGSRWAM